jgi:hypothetical protein
VRSLEPFFYDFNKFGLDFQREASDFTDGICEIDEEGKKDGV